MSRSNNKRKSEDNQNQCRYDCMSDSYNPEICGILDCNEEACHKIKFPGFLFDDCFETSICHSHYDHYDKNPEFYDGIELKKKNCENCKSKIEPQYRAIVYHSPKIFREIYSIFYKIDEETIKNHGYCANDFIDFKRSEYEKYKYPNKQNTSKSDNTIEGKFILQDPIYGMQKVSENVNIVEEKITLRDPIYGMQKVSESGDGEKQMNDKLCTVKNCNKKATMAPIFIITKNVCDDHSNVNLKHFRTEDFK